MAEDVIALLNYVGWTEHRDLHVVGISLGGMIAQGIEDYLCVRTNADVGFVLELAARIPERIISLTLIVTLPGSYLSFWSNFPSVCTYGFTPRRLSSHIQLCDSG